MKTKYPRYGNNAHEKIEKSMTPESKVILLKFINHCKTTAGQRKADKIWRHILQFYDVTETELDKQTKETVNGFLIALNNSDRSGWTKNEIKIYLKKFLKWQYKDLDLIENIKGSKRDRQVKITESDLITEKEFEKLLSVCSGFRNKAMLCLFYESGARPQELLNLQWKHIKFEEDFADITLHSEKTGETRTFPVIKSREFLWYWKENYPFPNQKINDLVFPSPYNRDKPLTSAGANKLFRNLANKAGIRKDVWNYLFRHSVATRLYEELPTPIVEKLMGHKNMSHIYAHISSKKAKEALLNNIYKVERIPESKSQEFKELQEKVRILEKIIGEQNGKR